MTVTPDRLLLTNEFLLALDLIGVFVMGIVGGALARRLQFDAVGFSVLGIISGLGGGVIRDLVLDSGTPAAFASPWYLTASLGGVGLAYILQTETRFWRHTITMLDCLALGLWAAIGTAKSIAHGLDPLPAIMLGLTTAVGGGVIRDVVVGRIPIVFGGGPLYATAAIITSILTWLVYLWDLPAFTVVGASLIGAAVAIVAQWQRWQLPSAPDLSVTLSPTQMRTLIRRIRKDERKRVALETGAIPVVDLEHDDFADDAAANPPDSEP